MCIIIHPFHILHDSSHFVALYEEDLEQVTYLLSSVMKREG